MMKNTLKLSGAFLFVVIVVACGGDESDGRSAATGDWAQERAEEARRNPAAVEAVEATRGSILRRIEGAGTIRGETEVTVISEASGRIEDAAYELGRFVEEGDLLVRIDDTIARSNMQEAQGIYESAQLDLEATRRRIENGSASRAELTRARSTADGARARLEAAQKTLRDHTLRAPVSGYIAFKGVGISRGNYLERGVPVARIVDLTTVRVEIGVGERELQFLETGANAHVTVPACGPEPYAATVYAIGAGADERTGGFPVIIRWVNTCDRIRSGMGAGVSIEPDGSRDEIIVPASAIVRDQNKLFVFVTGRDGQEKVAERREVVIGDRLGDRVQILSGVEEGDIVLTSGLLSLESGQPVEATVLEEPGDTL